MIIPIIRIFKVVIASGRNGLVDAGEIELAAKNGDATPLTPSEAAQWLGSVSMVARLAVTVRRPLVHVYGQLRGCDRHYGRPRGSDQPESPRIGAAADPEWAHRRGCHGRLERRRGRGRAEKQRRLRRQPKSSRRRSGAEVGCGRRKVQRGGWACARSFFLFLRQLRLCCIFAAQIAVFFGLCQFGTTKKIEIGQLLEHCFWVQMP